MKFTNNKIQQELYKKNTELDAVNELLSLLRKLYQISLLTLDPSVLAERITTVMRDSLHLEMAGIFVFDSKSDILSPLYFAKSERLISILHKLGFLFRDIAITEVAKCPAFKKIFDGESFVTANLADIWGGLISDEILKDISVSANVKTIIVHPLLAEERVIGVVILGLTSEYDQIWTTKKESLRSLADVIAVALDKAYLYKGLQDANEKLKIFDILKSKFLSLASHQLRNPVSNIITCTSMFLEGSFGKIDELQKKMLIRMFQGAQDMNDSIEKYLTIAKIDQGGLQYNLEKLDLADIAKDIIEQQKLAAEKRKLILSFETDERFPYCINGDKLQLKQVIQNLIDNAMKFTKEGWIKVKLSKDEPAGKIRLTVSDSGMGIKPEIISQLFKEFSRGEGAKVDVGGSGIGLYLAKEVIEKGHHGKIWAESEGAGKGSTFFLELSAHSA